MADAATLEFKFAVLREIIDKDEVKVSFLQERGVNATSVVYEVDSEKVSMHPKWFIGTAVMIHGNSESNFFCIPSKPIF